MFGLTRDFIQQDGISMQLGTAEGLSAAQLNMVQARMLANTVIPHHLRLVLREIDLQITLEYAVSRRKMLSHLLKSERLSMGELFSLLLQVVRGMEEGRLYMLRAEQYALHEDYIFIEGPLSSGRVFLTYIPLQSAEQPSLSTGDAVKSLVMVLMASVTELSGNGLQRLLQYCGSMEFTPAGLKSLLAELLAEDSPEGSPEGRLLDSTEVVAPPIPYTVPRQSWARPQEAAAAGNPNKEQIWASSFPKLKLTDETDLPESQAADEGEDDARPSSYRTYVALGAVLIDALLWKFLYLDSPATLWLAVCLGATAILACLCWMVWSGRILSGTIQDEDEIRGALKRKPQRRRSVL